MKILNKLISLILSFSLIAASVVFASSNEENISAATGENAYKFLMATGVLDPNEVPYDANFATSRAHFVKLALYLSNDAPRVVVSDDEVFADVNSGTQYEEYIETAFRLGYISGGYGLNFNPDEAITLPQALKILVNILGYGQMAELKGGYPTGYYSVAQNLDLLEQISADFADGLTFGDAMILLANSAKADILQPVSYGDDVRLEAKEGITLLSERHKIENVEGIINANVYTEIYAQNSELDKNQIKLDDVVYSISSPELAELIGQRVDLYYRNDSSKLIKEAVYADVSDENMIVSALPDKLEADGKSLKVYDEDDNYKSYKFSGGASYIVNNKMSAMTVSELCDISCGDVTLISNDGDKNIDVIVVTKYDNMVAEGVDSSNGIIIAKDGSRFEVKADSDDYTALLEKDGLSANVSDIKQGDSILVASSVGSGHGYIEILASSKKLSGSFSEVGNDYALLNGNNYAFCGVSSSDIVPGKQYTVLINAFGEIGYVENNNDVVYGYLYAIAKNGFNKAKCKIFTENNRWVELDFADKVKFTDASTHKQAKLTGDEVYSELSKLGDNLRQMARYTVNSNAEVITLELASADYALGSGNEDIACDEDIFRISCTGSKTYYSVNNFECEFFIDANTKIFRIPSDMDESKFAIKSYSLFTNNEDYTVTAYDVDDMFGCEVMTLTDLTLEEVYTDKFMLVTGKGMKINAEGEAVSTLIGYRNGLEISVPVEIGDDAVTNEQYNNIGKGSLIISKFDDKGNIYFIKSYDLNDEYYTSNSSLYKLYLVMGGRVAKNDSSIKRLRVAYDEAGTETGLIYNASTIVQIWDKSEQSLKPVTTESILPGDMIYAKMRYLTCNEIIIVRD